MDKETIQKVWSKAKFVNAANEYAGFRKDECDAWIHEKAYGDRNSKYGWEIDHIKPIANGGGDQLSNLRPLHWQNNAGKKDGRLMVTVTASGSENVIVRK